MSAARVHATMLLQFSAQVDLQSRQTPLHYIYLVRSIQAMKIELRRVWFLLFVIILNLLKRITQKYNRVSPQPHTQPLEVMSMEALATLSLLTFIGAPLRKEADCPWLGPSKVFTPPTATFKPQIS